MKKGIYLVLSGKIGMTVHSNSIIISALLLLMILIIIKQVTYMKTGIKITDYG